MNQRAILTTTAAAILSTFLSASLASAQTATKEKCYGIAEAGKNDCGNLDGTHSCAGQSKVANDLGEWKYVPKGECKTMNGFTADEAKKKLANTNKDDMKKDDMKNADVKKKEMKKDGMKKAGMKKDEMKKDETKK